MNNNQPIYELFQVSKYVNTAAETLYILDQIDMQVSPGESLAIVGASGSGKTTLLQLMGAIDQPTQGQILFQGQDINVLNRKDKAALRNKHIGFVFQFHHLLPEFNTLENVAMPALIAGTQKKLALDKAAAKLQTLGLQKKLQANVTTLSGGERQLAAIARAALLEPQVILADEPTGNLDARNWNMVGDILANINAQMSTTLIVVTHNMELAHKMQRKIELQNGKLYAS